MPKKKEEEKKPESSKASELYRQTENIQELKDKLRDTYLAYKESAGRCKLEMKPKGVQGSAPAGTGAQAAAQPEQEFRNFYIPPGIPQLQEPERQKKFRNEYIAEVGQRPSGEQLAYLADTLHLEALEAVADGSRPSRAREALAAFFKRHAVYLRHKKYMMLGRWANELRHSQQVDQAGTHFDRMVSRLQQELDSALSRGDRLDIDDSYDSAVDSAVQRPQPTSSEQDGTRNGALLYVEAPGRSVNSVVKLDDFEVHLRIQTYRSKLFRMPEKLATSIKWLPHSHRFEIWKESRAYIYQDKANYEIQRDAIIRPIEQQVKQHLIAEGVMDKLRDIVESKYVAHLKGTAAANRVDELYTCYTCTHERPPFLYTSNVELRSKLIPLAREWALTVEGYLDVDDGSQFTYQVNGLFPPEFQKQVLEMQFDGLDSGEGTQADTDILLIQKLTTELGLDKHAMLGEMARQAEVERNKSILGQIKQDQHQPEGASARPGGATTGDKNEDVARANLIRRIKEMNFFSLDVTEYKLRKADWLRYVCWQPTTSEVVKRQNFALSSHSSNPIDSLLMSAFEFIDVNEAGAANKILEDSATAHVRKVRGYFADISQKNPWTGHGDPSATVEAVLRDATLGPIAGLPRRDNSQRSDDVQYDPAKVEAQIQNIDPLKQHLLKSYYSLRLLKCRGIKTKMLQTLNYFRAVQKRLAFDVREFYSRERALGGKHVEESLIGPQFGKDEAGNLKAKKGGTGGPGGINANRIERDLDDGTGSIQRESQEPDVDPVSLKGYKYNKRFNPALTSTCPCVPRFHTTFGRPTLYEEVSQEMERRHGEDGRWRAQATPIPAYKDRLIFKRTGESHLECEIAVIDEDGTKIVFEEAVNDMLLLEEEMIKIGSFFLNKAEFQQHTGASEQPATMLDRGEVALHLFEQELELQLTKASLIESLVEVYEHTCDPLESVRVLQVIADTMAIRPRVNLEATYFRDSYKSEIGVIQEKLQLYQEVLEIQARTERAQNLEIRRFQELKLRKLTDYIDGKWKYGHQPTKVERVGTKEEQERGVSLDNARQGKRAQYLKEMQKQLALREIAERHITEFAGDQHTDFANVLGLPEVTASDLFKKQAQQDPIVVDAIREHSHLSKQIEGYPWFFRSVEETQPSLGLHTTGAGLTDFYDSLCAVTRVHAACVQGFGELTQVHRPENGLASSSLERAMLAEARGRLRVLRNQEEEGVYNLTKAANRVEEDFYLSSSDKLVFLMREFKAELNPATIHKTASPLLVGKLAASEVAKFDFPRIKQAEVEGYEELNDEQLTEQMIALAKVSISRPLREEVKGADGSAEGGSAAGDADADELRDMQIQSPSMMVLACNLLEVLRLRKVLIKLIHESDVLEDINKQQQKDTNTSTGKLVQSEGIPFETQSIAKGNMNLVDLNDGSNLELDLAAREFDGTLKACLDLRSESCIKALMTDLGVEELRAVVHYQLMQKQLLTIAVTRNQILMDGPQQGVAEVDLLKTKITKTRILVPAAQVRHKDVITCEGPREELLEKERRRLSSQLTKEVAGHMYSVPQKKSEHRTAVSTKYAQAYQKVLGTSRSAEAKLRVLRGYRLRLLHEFCRDVLKQAYSDSLSIQTLLACRELRRKAYLFPKEPALFTVGQGFPEHLPAALTSPKDDGDGSSIPAGETPSLAHILNGRPKTLFYIPTSGEIMEACQNQPSGVAATPSEPFNENDVDESVKRLCKSPTMHLVSQSQILPSNRAVTFREAYAYKSRPAELLQFCSLLLQIVSIEYLMGRNNSPGEQILELEGAALSGRPIWDVKPSTPAEEPAEEVLRYAPDRVITKIMHRKRAHVDLAEDLGQISLRLLKMEQFVKTSNSDHLKLPYLLDLLQIQHQSSFLHFMNGLENTLDIYLDHKSDDCFAKVQDALSTLARRDQGFNLLGNGLYLNQGTRRGTQIDLASSVLEDHDQFSRCYQPVVDENAMIPPQLALVRRLYGFSAQQAVRAPTALLSVASPDYNEMSCSFLNLDDEQRAFIATNFYQLEEGLTEYLVFAGHIPDPAAKAGGEESGRTVHIARPKEILEAQVEYLGLKVEARHLQRVLMSWSTCSALPLDTQGYQTAMALFREQTMLKVLLERDALTEHYYESKAPSSEGGNALGAAAKKRAQERATILESVNPFSREHTVVSRLHQTKAEISVASRVLDVEMIKMSLDMIQREHAALHAAFEQGAADDKVHAHVHPQQQFASTLYQSVDQNSHLDVVNKLGFVQSFLTKLRNRCTEVETLASGPGIVFSMKDFNECLQVFCQGLLKYGEAELRSRVETQHIRQNQYQHLLYMKEKQALYFRRKCEQFLGDIDKLVNAKISQKGSQLIYELDVSSRELRVLRDNYNLMHTMMMEELRHEYMREINEKENKIGQLRDRFRAHRQLVTAETTAEVSDIFKEQQDVLDAMRAKEDAEQEKNYARPRGNNGQSNHSLYGGNVRAIQGTSGPNTTQMEDKVAAGATFELVAGPRRELLSLQGYMRKYKVLTMMKNVLASERHERELANQRAQLTSNAALWDQLAEAEKREQITKQELTLTKLSLASYEKLIEKLQGQLENLNNQKARLQQYKNSKSKRMYELENKMKDLEILENIDLNRILSELKSRDRKIEGLETKVQRNEQAGTLTHQYQNSKAVHDLKGKLSMERELKLQAFDRLEGLRVEMRALEGKDMKSDLWKDKCRELFDICKELERENDDLKGLVKDANHANLLQAAGELEMQSGLPLHPDPYHHPETVAPASGARSNLAAHGAERLVSSRTLGLGGGRDYARHASGHGLGYATSGGSYPSGGQGFEAGSSLVNARQAARKAGGGGPFGSNLHQTNQETLHSDGFQSHYLSGAPGMPQAHQGEAEVLSLGSGGIMDPQMVVAGHVGPSGSLAGGVFGDPLASLQQPRGIMTAGGGARPQYHPDPLAQNRARHPVGGAKRLLTSQGPVGGHSIGKLGSRGGQRGVQGKAPVNRAGPQAGSLQARTRLHYASHNSGSLALAGANIQSQGRTGHPNVVDGQRFTGVMTGQNMQQIGQATKIASLASGNGTLGSSTMPRLPHPVNVNINFNTTHISVPPK